MLLNLPVSWKMMSKKNNVKIGMFCERITILCVCVLWLWFSSLNLIFSWKLLLLLRVSCHWKNSNFIGMLLKHIIVLIRWSVCLLQKKYLFWYAIVRTWQLLGEIACNRYLYLIEFFFVLLEFKMVCSFDDKLVCTINSDEINTLLYWRRMGFICW